MLDQLKQSPIFDSLTEQQLEDVSRYLDIVELESGEILFEQGDLGENLFTVLDGLLKISLHDSPSGREKTIAILGQGEIVGEMATLGNQKRSAQATAIRMTSLIKIPEDQFRELISQYPDIALGIINILSQRLMMSDEEIQSVTFKSIPGRLAAQLLRLSDQFGHDKDTGREIDIKLTHQQLSDLVGTNRETITRYLNEFEDEGSIEFDNQMFTVKNAEKLENWM